MHQKFDQHKVISDQADLSFYAISTKFHTLIVLFADLRVIVRLSLSALVFKIFTVL